jgi:hypothetical protein
MVIANQLVTVDQATPGPVSSVTLRAAVPPTSGGDVTWTATAVGGIDPLSYKWRVTADGGANWTLLQDWMPGASTFVWTPVVGSGPYTLDVWARSEPTVGDAAEASVQAIIRTAADGCLYAVSPASRRVGHTTQTVVFSVDTQPDCAWTSTSATDFAGRIAGGNGPGTGSVSYAVEANATAAARAVSLTVAGASVTITQDTLPPCVISVSPRLVRVGAGGDTPRITVDAPSDCEWTAGGHDLSFNLEAGGMGPGLVDIYVGNNPGDLPRALSAFIGGQTVMILQAGVTGEQCTYSIGNGDLDFGTNADDSWFTITTSFDYCPWVLSDTQEWITTSRTGGTGSARVDVFVTTNTGPQRNGYIYVADVEIPVEQNGTTPPDPDPDPSECTFAVSQNSFIFHPSGGEGSLQVFTGPACSWSATSSNDFASISSGSAQTGSGVVTVTVGPAPNADLRTTTLTIAGQPIVVAQGVVYGGFTCEPSLSQDSLHFPQSGGTATVSVMAPAGCEWSAAADVDWASINDGQGAGNGNVTVTVSANDDLSTRGGNVVINGATLTIAQDSTATVASLVVTQQQQRPAFQPNANQVICDWSYRDLPRGIVVVMRIYLDGQQIATNRTSGPTGILRIVQNIPRGSTQRISVCEIRYAHNNEYIDSAELTHVPTPPPSEVGKCSLPPINKPGVLPGITLTHRFDGPWGPEFFAVWDGLDAWSDATFTVGLDVLIVPAFGGNGTLTLRKDTLEVGVLGVTGGARAPIVYNPDGYAVGGTIIFTTNRQWLRSTTTFKKVAMHELGHLLGLADNPSFAFDRSSVMNEAAKADDSTDRMSFDVKACDARQAYWASKQVSAR